MVDLPIDGNPLTEDHLTQMNNSLETLKRARTAISLASRAGLDTTTQKAAVDDLEAKIRLIKSTYFPGR